MTIKELHKKTLPEHKRKSVKIDVVSFYIWRPICDLLTILFLKTKTTANQVTIVSFYSCLISLACFAFISGMKGALLGYLFFWIWNIADGIDGNIARYTDSVSRSGDLWDAVAGYAAMAVFFIGAGITAAGENSLVVLPFTGAQYVEMGSFAALCMLFPRLATQKKESVYGKFKVTGLKDKANFGFVKKIGLNLTSINGLAGLLFLISILTRTSNLFVVVYTFIMFAFGIVAMLSVMQNLED